MPDRLLEIERLRVRYRRMGLVRALLTGVRDPWLDAVLDVSLTLDSSQTYGLVGESGAGKTTLGRAVIGLSDTHSGSIRFQGQELTGLPESAYKPHRRRTTVSIAGEVPSLESRPQGCEFHTRCPFAKDRCREQAPGPTELEPGHSVRCHFPLG